ncbi:MAG: EamA family transporter [Dehalococcoidia bacterium]
MNWIDSAILAALVLAAVNVIDSHLITRRMPGLLAFLFPVGIMAILYGLIIIVSTPIPEEAETSHFLYAVGSSFIRSLSVGSFLYAMKKAEVSRVMPVVNTHPVYVAVMAFVLLDESLAGLEWFAILITVAGAVLISVRWGEGSISFNLNRYAALPFLSALCLAGANLTSKYALEGISSWNMYAVGSLVWGSVCVAFSARPKILAQLPRLERRGSTLSILFINETLAAVAIALLFWSIERGPVSLVSTIAGAQPVFVFFYAMMLSRISGGALLEERMAKKKMASRFFAIALIFGGVTIIHLF